MNENQRCDRRVYPAEFRVVGEGDEPRGIAGHAALFNVWSVDLGGFKERIAPGAFTDALATSDVRGLINHEESKLLGRTKSGTMVVRQDELGLAMDIPELPDTSYANDLRVLASRGDMSQMSFGFRVAPDGDEWKEDGGTLTRTVHKVLEILDVSVVTFPAYPATGFAVRSLNNYQAELRDEAARRTAHALRVHDLAVEETSFTGGLFWL